MTSNEQAEIIKVVRAAFPNIHGGGGVPYTPLDRAMETVCQTIVRQIKAMPIGPSTESILLPDGTRLHVGEACRAQKYGRWYDAVVADILWENGVARAIVRGQYEETWIANRYSLAARVAATEPQPRRNR